MNGCWRVHAAELENRNGAESMDVGNLRGTIAIKCCWPSVRGQLRCAVRMVRLEILILAQALPMWEHYIRKPTKTTMKRITTLSLAVSLLATGLFAQSSSIIMFAEGGDKFTLIVDGQVKNEQPASRVVATDIKNETPMLVVRFADAGIPELQQNGWLEFGKEYTIRITTNRKGKRVLKMQGVTPLGSATAIADQPVPAHFTEDVPAETGTTGTTGTVGMDTPATVKSTTTVTTTDGTVGQDVNMNIGVNGVGLTMNVNDGMGGTSTTTTTTTTYTTTTNTTLNQDVTMDTESPVEVAPVEEVIASDNGCSTPMSTTDFSSAVASINDKGFDETKVTLAKQIGNSNCLSTDQVKTIMGLFGFEDSRLDFAKFAYDHVTDRNNFYKVNDAFSFSSSVDELNAYIQSR